MSDPVALFPSRLHCVGRERLGNAPEPAVQSVAIETKQTWRPRQEQKVTEYTARTNQFGGLTSSR